MGLDWSYEIEDLREIVQCFEGAGLKDVCEVMCQEYAQRGGGVPDLFLWRMYANVGDEESSKGKDVKVGSTHGVNGIMDEGRKRGEVLFTEVKSENDRLSDTQRLWINVLMGAGIRVELCNAVAKEVRRC